MTDKSFSSGAVGLAGYGWYSFRNVKIDGQATPLAAWDRKQTIVSTEGHDRLFSMRRFVEFSRLPIFPIGLILTVDEKRGRQLPCHSYMFRYGSSLARD